MIICNNYHQFVVIFLTFLRYDDPTFFLFSCSLHLSCYGFGRPGAIGKLIYYYYFITLFIFTTGTAFRLCYFTTICCVVSAFVHRAVAARQRTPAAGGAALRREVTAASSHRLWGKKLPTKRQEGDSVQAQTALTAP